MKLIDEVAPVMKRKVCDLSPMARYLIWVMEGRGVMDTQSIYRAVKQCCHRMGYPLPAKWQAGIRQTLQAHCPSRPRHNKKDDFFVYHRRGCWSCRVTLAKLG